MFKVRWHVPLLLAVTTITLAAASVVASTTVDIQGTLSTGPGERLHEPVLVRLLSGENEVQEQLAGFNGQFRFKKVLPGSYVIRIERDGYNLQDVPIVTTSPTYRIQITLQATPIESAFSGAHDPFTSLSVSPAARKEFELGMGEQKIGRCDAALQHFQKAVALYPKYGDAFDEIGNCDIRSGNFQGAEESFKKAMAFSDPVHPAVKLSDLYLVQKRYDEAQNLILKLLPQNPTEGDLYAAIARVYYAVGRIRDAELAGLEAQSRTHQSADVHLLLAKIYEEQNNRPARITQLRAYLDENPRGAKADEVRKLLLGLTGNP